MPDRGWPGVPFLVRPKAFIGPGTADDSKSDSSFPDFVKRSLLTPVPGRELPKTEGGGGPAGVKEAADEGGGPAGVVEGWLNTLPPKKEGLRWSGVCRPGVDGGLLDGTANILNPCVA